MINSLGYILSLEPVDVNSSEKRFDEEPGEKTLKVLAHPAHD